MNKIEKKIESIVESEYPDAWADNWESEVLTEEREKLRRQLIDLVKLVEEEKKLKDRKKLNLLRKKLSIAVSNITS
jgi:hypothetical protein